MVARPTSYSMSAPTEQSPRSLRAGHCEFLEVEESELDTSCLHAHLVSPVAKQRLLSSQSTLYGTQDDAATSLLTDLARLAPTVAKDYLPKSSTRNTAAFRLINDVYFEGEEESYIALSYVWHKISRDAPKKIISPVGDLPFGWVQTVEQFPLPTTKGMFQAVLNERRDNEGLWFDQVCINQEDQAEKAMAIGNMDTIYSNARIVVVALDDISTTVEEINFLEQYNHQYVVSDLPFGQHPNYGLNPPIMQQHHLFRIFVERVLSSIWFERAWCAQEMLMGQKFIFLVPCAAEYEDESAYTIARFTETFFVHMLTLASEVITSSATQQKIRSLVKHFAGLQSHHTTPTTHSRSCQSISSPTRPLVATIATIFNMKAGGNPRLPEYLRRLDANRDKTSIALNLSGIPLVLKPASPLQRPTIEDECLRQLLLVGIAARDAVALCTTGAPLQLHDGSISWLCKPTPLDLPASYLTPPPAFQQTASPIAQGSDGRAEYVQLDLTFVDLPHRAYPKRDFSVNAHRAREVIDLCVQYQVRSHTLWNLLQVPNHPRAPAMRNIFIQTLACIFECGAPWLLDVVSQPCFPSGGLGLDLQALEMLFNPQLMVQTYINLPFYSALLNTVGTLIAHGVPWASTASEQTHGPLIVSAPPFLPLPGGAASSSAYIPSSTASRAVIFAPFAHSNTLLVAIPAAVTSPDYAGLARGWVLTTSNPYTGSPKTTVSWVLRGKAPIFGEQSFNVALGKSDQVSVRNHRVYGPGVGGT